MLQVSIILNILLAAALIRRIRAPKPIKISGKKVTNITTYQFKTKKFKK